MRMKQDTRELFKMLTELQGAPSDEHRIRSFMTEQLKKYTDDVIYDRLGGVFGVRKGKGPRVLVAGHMDVVGFMVTQITQNGILCSQPLGCLWITALIRTV